MDKSRHEFVAYDANGNVIESRAVKPGLSLERFAADYPFNEVAEVRNAREVRVIPAEPRP